MKKCKDTNRTLIEKIVSGMEYCEELIDEYIREGTKTDFRQSYNNR